MTLIERLQEKTGSRMVAEARCNEAANVIKQQAARIAELEAGLIKAYSDLTTLRRKIDEAPVVAWLCEGEDIYGEYYCYVVSATPPDQDHVTIKPLISRGDLQG